jgi:hypothetical protein
MFQYKTWRSLLLGRSCRQEQTTKTDYEHPTCSFGRPASLACPQIGVHLDLDPTCWRASSCIRLPCDRSFSFFMAFPLLLVTTYIYEQLCPHRWREGTPMKQMYLTECASKALGIVPIMYVPTLTRLARILSMHEMSISQIAYETCLHSTCASSRRLLQLLQARVATI